jgi:hypothetical protein
MRRAFAEASGGVARLKPGRKASATSKCRRPRGDTDERPARGDTRLYKTQSELDCLGIDAEYLRENGMDLFHLGALGRLMRCVLSLHPSLSWKLTPSSRLRLYPRLDPARPQDIAESIAAETIQILRALVAQFTRGLVRRVIVLRELAFALCAHTKV